jgi:hypothetical protein
MHPLSARRPREQSLIILLHSFVALAGRLLQPADIFDMEIAPLVSDQTFSMELARDICDARSPDPDHSCQIVLSERQIFAYQLIHSQHPAAHPRPNWVESIAGGRLLDIRYEELFVRSEEASNGGSQAHRFTKRIAIDDGSGAWQLDDDPVDGHFVVKSLRDPDGTIATDHSGLHDVAISNLDHA